MERLEYLNLTIDVSSPLGRPMRNNVEYCLQWLKDWLHIVVIGWKYIKVLQVKSIAKTKRYRDLWNSNSTPSLPPSLYNSKNSNTHTHTHTHTNPQVHLDLSDYDKVLH